MHPAIRPLLGLLEMWPAKLVISLAAAVLWSLVREVLDVYAVLLVTDQYLLVIAASFILLDTLTGVGRAVLFGNGFRSLNFRQGGWKLIEYGTVVYMGVVLANGTEHLWLVGHFFAQWDEGALFYVILTEFFSTIENLRPDSEGNIKRAVMHPYEWIKEKVNGNFRPS